MPRCRHTYLGRRCLHQARHVGWHRHHRRDEHGFTTWHSGEGSRMGWLRALIGGKNDA